MLVNREHRISRVRRARFGNMRIIARIVVGRAADTAWVQDQRAIRYLDQVLLVAVPTKNDASLSVPQPFLDRRWVCSHQPAIRYILYEVLIVIRRRTVAKMPWPASVEVGSSASQRR